MNPLRHPKTNAELGKPADWNDERDGPCLGLPVVRSHDTDGMPCMDSYWRPTPVEMKALQDGGAVNLRVFSKVHPVVWVGAIDRQGRGVDQDKPLIYTS